MKAHYFVRNMQATDILRLMCYGTKYPHTLTSTQKVTRLYRAFLRRQNAVNLQENKSDPAEFHEQVNEAIREFKTLLTTPEDSAQFRQTMQKYEKWIEVNVDPTAIVNQSRPYAANSAKYYVFNDQQLNFDPYGFYKPRTLSGRNPGQGFVFYPDFPQDNNHWTINLEGTSDDADLESKSFKSS